MVPETDAVLPDRYPAFVWTAHPDATHYRLVVRRAGAPNPRIRIRLAAEQICEGGFCGVDSLGLSPAAPLGFDRQFTWQVIAFAGDTRLGSARGQFSVQRPAQPTSTPTMTPYYTPEGQPPVGLETNYESPLRNVRSTVNLTANGPGQLTNHINTANSNPNNHYVITLIADQIYSKPGPSAPASAPLGASAYPYITGKVTIVGNNAILERSSASTELFRILTVGTGGFLRVENLTVRLGRASKIGGAGILNHEGTLEIYRSTIINNRAVFTTDFQVLGGGVYSFYGSLTITESIIRNNRALTTNSDGGGIGIIQIKPGATLAIQGSDIRNNHANRRGNGVYVQDTNRPLMNNNCFVGNYHPNPLNQTTNRSVQERTGLLRVANSWWGTPTGPLINQAATTNNDSISGTATYVPFKMIEPVRCDRPYNFNIANAGTSGFSMWSADELQAISDGVHNVGLALDRVSTIANTPQDAFNRIYNAGQIQTQPGVLFVRADTRTNLGYGNANPDIQVTFHHQGQDFTVIYPDIANGFCRAFEAQFFLTPIPNAVVCNGELLNQSIGGNGRATQYTIVHELGHIFDYRSGNMLTNGIATNYSLGSCNTQEFFGDNYVVMGYLTSTQPFLRGTRGWGSGPGFSTFQQSGENIALEAAADMFLNWVYRSNHPNGASRVTGVSTTPIGTPSPPQSGCTTDTFSENWVGFLNRN